MFKARHIYAGLIGCCAILTGCTTNGTIKEVQSMDGGRVMLTSADVRMISQVTPRKESQPGVILPQHITCAEPSPDVAKAVSATLQVGTTLSAGLPTGVSPEVAAAITRARAESIAQLGERLATISLLRDALYRACEAYANGALSSTAYAILLSRYDDTMITLQNSELAAGAFGRTLAGASGEGSGKASAKLDTKSELEQQSETLSELSESLKRSSELENSLKQIENSKSELHQKRKELKPLIGQLEAERDAAIATGDTERQEDAERQLELEQESLEQLDFQLEQLTTTKTSVETALEQTRKSTHSVKRNLEKQLESAAEGAAKADVVVAGGIEPGKQTAEIAALLARMQKDYLNNVNADASDVACAVAMDRQEADLTALGNYCKDNHVLTTSAETKKYVIQRMFDLQEKKLDMESGAKRVAGASSPTPPRKLSVETVKWIRTSLNKVANIELTVDGIMGPDTEKAIRSFQSTHGLKVDGIPGPLTRAKLRDNL